MSSSAITFPANNDLSGLRLEQTRNGNLVSPWFSFPHDVIMIRGGDMADYNDPRFRAIRDSAISAFASFLQIRPLDVVFTELNDPSDVCGRKWRLGTRHPHALPKPPRVEKPVLPENRGAIDI